MDLTEGSETSAKLNLAPGKYPKENMQDVKTVSTQALRLRNRVYDRRIGDSTALKHGVPDEACPAEAMLCFTAPVLQNMNTNSSQCWKQQISTFGQQQDDGTCCCQCHPETGWV
jgi:hypothetical protein